MNIGARQAALEILEKCRRSKAWSGASIDSSVKKYGLDRREAALTSQLCLGVLQNAQLCDFYISCWCSAKLEPKVRDVLRLGVYQLLFLDKIPASAAVNESVSLCRQSGFSRAAGLVNAVLRRVAENRDTLPELPGAGTAEYLATKYSHPLWLAEYMLAERGYDFTEQLFAADNRIPALTIQVNTLKVPTADYLRALDRADRPYRLREGLDGCIELDGGSVAALPGFEEGLFYVQDAAARAAVAVSGIQPGMRVLDACSCPGGKSFAAALQMKGEGSILACDIHEKKLALVRGGAERLGIGIISTRTMDAREFDPALEDGFDAVIADVPCSGLGVIRKKPEIREKTREELASLPAIQSAILDNLSRYVRPGGTLLYSTCTVLQEENENAVRDFLSRHGDFTPTDFSLGGIHSEEGTYTFFPQIDGTDGFFAARLTRNS